MKRIRRGGLVAAALSLGCAGLGGEARSIAPHPTCIRQCTLPLRPIAKCTDDAHSKDELDSAAAGALVTAEGALRPGGVYSWSPNCAKAECCGEFEAFAELHTDASSDRFVLSGKVTTARNLSHRLSCVRPAGHAVSERLQRTTIAGSVIWSHVHQENAPAANESSFCCTIPVVGQRVRVTGTLRLEEDRIPKRAFLIDPIVCEL